MTDDITERLQGEIMEAAQRLINTAFDNRGSDIKRAQFSIPADPSRDSDLLVTRGIQEAHDEITRLRTALAASEARVEKAREALTFVVKCSPVEWSSGDERYIQMFERAATTLKDIA